MAMSTIDLSTSLVMESRNIPIGLLLLFVNIKASVSSFSDALHIEFESPRVNCRNVSAGRIKYEEYKKEHTRNSDFVVCICKKVDGSEAPETLIPGINIFSPNEDVTAVARYDFSVDSKDACFPLFLLSSDLPQEQVLVSDYEATYEGYAKEVAERSKGNLAVFFTEVLIKFDSKYNSFKNSEDFQCLIDTISKFSVTPEDVDGSYLNRLPVTLRAAIWFQNFSKTRFCIVDANHRTTWFFCAACGLTCETKFCLANSVLVSEQLNWDSIEPDMTIVVSLYHKPALMTNQDFVSLMLHESDRIQKRITKTTKLEDYHLT